VRQLTAGYRSVKDLLSNKDVDIDIDIRLLMLKDVVHGMAFLHAADPPVLHGTAATGTNVLYVVLEHVLCLGDLKSANLLLDSNLRVKITDFGLSHLSKVAGVGTPIYMAPVRRWV
jgi:serine/threonine protein kinase